MYRVKAGWAVKEVLVVLQEKLHSTNMYIVKQFYKIINSTKSCMYVVKELVVVLQANKNSTCAHIIKEILVVFSRKFK